MGLDMYAVAIDREDWDGNEADTVLPTSGAGVVRVKYWRKHHDLHGWMHRLYEQKNGQDPDFNLNKVVLTEQDLLRLADDIANNKLPATSGFFFGDFPPNEESQKEDLEFVAQALELVRSRDKVVIYDSWW